MMEEKTLIFIKPDGVQRMLVGRILSRFEDKGLVLRGLKLMQLTEALARKHYAVHEGKPFFEGLIQYVTSGPIVAMVWSGVRAIEVCRRIMGATFGWQADPGTIRGDFGISGSFNLIHGSDSPESAEVEIPLYFEPSELVEWDPAAKPWIYDIRDDFKS
ncbi:MAG: nucleoside-diphosphate kinase [Planctomycetota bacterium]|jgi:nucleoside-diphosphate kinase